MDHSNKLTVDNIIQRLAAQIKDAMDSHGGIKGIARLDITKPVADDTIKLKIHNREGNVSAIALCSSSASHQLVDRNIDRACLVRNALKSQLGQVILEPIKRGKFNGLSYVVLPYCEPISENRLRRFLQRRYLRPRILEWLRQAAADTSVKPGLDEFQKLFFLPLQQIISNKKMSDQVRAAANIAVERLSAGEWHPNFVVAHNDLWEGNLLFSSKQKTSGFGFVIIDWPGGEVKGHAIFDLIRIAISLKLSSRRLLIEVQAHCRILNCETLDAKGYLLASLGYMGMHLEHFPMDRYVAMAEQCFRLLDNLDC